MTSNETKKGGLTKDRILEELKEALVKCQQEKFAHLKAIWDLEFKEENIREELRKRRAL